MLGVDYAITQMTGQVIEGYNMRPSDTTTKRKTMKLEPGTTKYSNQNEWSVCLTTLSRNSFNHALKKLVISVNWNGIKMGIGDAIIKLKKSKE